MKRRSGDDVRAANQNRQMKKIRNVGTETDTYKVNICCDCDGEYVRLISYICTVAKLSVMNERQGNDDGLYFETVACGNSP